MKFFVLLFLLFSFSAGEVFAKVVTDDRGRKVDLRFHGWNGDVMEVEGKDKKRRIVPLESISETDQEWVRKHVRQDFKLAADINNRTFTLEDGRTVKADLVGLRKWIVVLQEPASQAKKGEKPERVEMPLNKFTDRDQFFIVNNAPMIGALNANPETRQHPEAIAAAAGKIDKYLDAYHKAKGQEPLPVINDATFVRRTYLVIIGRIPTLQEVNDFMESDDPQKRAQLIDALFEHEGYVHRMFNYWADLLRIKTRLPNRNYGGAMFAQWIKDSVRMNKPYDEMVREMLSARGYYWDNPAVGFYRRDLNMPLDNLAVMCQTLLGTSIVCAQCHDHPFDTWTQKEYYEMAAFTYPLVTRLRHQENPKVKELTQIAKKDQGKNYRQFSSETRRAFQSMVQYPLQSGVGETDRRLSYPKEYAYANAKPRSRVEPSTPFGEEATITDLKKESPVAPFVEWFVAPENPRFARNIANRMWKEMFGLGLVEPVDDIKFDTESFYPALMDSLTKMLIDLDFDLKAFQRVLARSKHFQRAAYADDVNPVDGYPMTGPLLRRMSAEQIWDSVMTLIVTDVDHRINDTLLNSDKQIAETGKTTLKSDPKEMYETIKEAQGKDYRAQQKMVMMMVEDDSKAKKAAPKKFVPPKRPPEMRRREYQELVQEARVRHDPYYAFPRQLFRAAELPSPAPGGHFLNMFGQSDREITENDNQEASIPQVLTLMNDERLLTQIVNNPHGALRKAVMAGESAREKIDAIFLSAYARPATGSEYRHITSRQTGDIREDVKTVVWAVLNSQRFRFIQ